MAATFTLANNNATQQAGVPVRFEQGYNVVFVLELVGEYDVQVTVENVPLAPFKVTASGFACAPGFRVQLDRCVPCLANQYQDSSFSKAEQCTPCPPLTETSAANADTLFTSRANCTCVAGTSAPDPLAPCTACPNPNACLSRGRGCAAGYGGFLCKDCAAGYYPLSDGTGSCARCAGAGVSAVLLLCYVLLCLVCAGVGLYVAMLASASLQASEGFSRKRRWPHTISLILLTLQIAAMIGVADLNWPSSAQRSLAAMRVVLLDVSTLASRCVLSSFSAQYVLALVTPIIIVGLALAMYLILYLAQPAALRGVSPVRMLASFVLQAVPLAYAPLVRSTLTLFDCTKLADGHSYLDADLSVRCYAAAWWPLLPLGIAGLIFYVVGPPIVLMALIYAKRKALFSASSTDYVAALMGASCCKLYRRACYATGPLLLVKRFVIVAVALFASRSPALLVPLFLAIVGGTALAQSKLAPFYDPLLNRVELGLSSLLCLLLLCGVVFLAGTSFQTTAVFFFIATLTALLLVAGCALGAELRHIRAERTNASQPPFEVEMFQYVCARLPDLSHRQAFLSRLGATGAALDGKDVAGLDSALEHATIDEVALELEQAN